MQGSNYEPKTRIVNGINRKIAHRQTLSGDVLFSFTSDKKSTPEKFEKRKTEVYFLKKDETSKFKESLR